MLNWAAFIYRKSHFRVCLIIFHIITLSERNSRYSLLDELNFILGNIEDKSEALLRYDMQNSVTDKEVALWEKTIDRLDMDYRPYNFRSYKLECQIQIVEKLALDKEPGPPPIDSIEKSCK